MTADRRREVDRLADEIQAALRTVRRKARRMSTAEAQTCLEDALRARNLSLPESVTGRFARSVTDPWWPMKHPLAYWKEAKEVREATSGHYVDASTDGPEFAWLEGRLEKVDQLRGIWAPGPVGAVGAVGVYVVTIDPWSERVAHRVHALAAPLQVVVRPLS